MKYLVLHRSSLSRTVGTLLFQKHWQFGQLFTMTVIFSDRLRLYRQRRRFGLTARSERLTKDVHATAASRSLSYSLHRINNPSRSTKVLLLQKLPREYGSYAHHILRIVSSQAGHLSDVQASSPFFWWAGISTEDLEETYRLPLLYLRGSLELLSYGRTGHHGVMKETHRSPLLCLRERLKLLIMHLLSLPLVPGDRSEGDLEDSWISQAMGSFQFVTCLQAALVEIDVLYTCRAHIQIVKVSDKACATSISMQTY